MSNSESEEPSLPAKAPGRSSPYECSICHYKCFSLPAMLDHIRSHSRDDPWNCYGCQNGIHSITTRDHYKHICPERWESQNSMEQFVVTTGEHKCTLCPFTSGRLYELVDHIQLHVRQRQDANEFINEDSQNSNRDNIYTCTECEFSCVRPDKLEAHMALHAPGAILECKHCALVLPSLKELRKHMKTHDPDRPFSCNLCQAKFTRRDNMQLHMASHVSDTVFQCRFCEYTTTNKTRMNHHYRSHKKSGVKTPTSTKASVDCPVCSRAFVSYPLLMFHIKAHALRPPYRCPTCDMSFDSVEETQEHLSVHVENVALSCAYCNFKCFDDTSIHNHLGAQHGSHKPFQCEVCDYRFSTMGHWKRHQLVHSGEKPFECDICGAKFCASGNRKAHMIKLHGTFIPLPRGKLRRQLVEQETTRMQPVHSARET